MTETVNFAALSFADLIGLTAEPNTPSGGHQTMDTILNLAQVPPFGRVLEIGCATGFTCLEIAALRPDVAVHGVDANSEAIEEARQKARDAGLTNATFHLADARTMPFTDETFDLVSCGNVPAFVDNRDVIIKECIRVTRPHGALIAIPIYYIENPPAEVRAAVEKAIGATIPEWDEHFWLSLYEEQGLFLRHAVRRRYRDIPAEEQETYARWVMSRSANARHDSVTAQRLQDLLVEHYRLFNENNRYAGYTILLFRKPVVNPERIMFETIGA